MVSQLGLGPDLLGRHRRARAIGRPHSPFHSHQTFVARGPEGLMPRLGELVVDCGPHVSPIAARELESLKDFPHHGIGEADGTDLHPLPQPEPWPILILQHMDLRIHHCQPGRHRGEVERDGPGLGGDGLAR